MKRTDYSIFIVFSALLLCGYILPYWFIIKESASVRSKFSIKKIRLNGSVIYLTDENELNCNSEFAIEWDRRELAIKILCNNLPSEFVFRDSKMVSQNIRGEGRYFSKPLTLLAENEDILIPLPISSERLKNKVCEIVQECSSVRYRRSGGSVNYQFFSPKSGNYYMIEKESFLPSALFIKDKDLAIFLKKYYSFSTNIRFPSQIEIRTGNNQVIFKIEDIDIE